MSAVSRGADSTECRENAAHKIIYKLRDLLGVDDLGGTMRLGGYPCQLEANSLARRVYGTDSVNERHRHRYEFNREFEQSLTEAGLRVSGRSPDGKFVEVLELSDHPWFVGGAVPPRIPLETAPPAPPLC